MKDNEIDGGLKAAQALHGPEPETLKRVTESIRDSLRRVRPLPPRSVLTGGLILIGAAIALASAARAGFFGLEKMNPWQRGLIFSALSIFLVIAAKEFVNAMIPGSWRRVSAGTLLGIGTTVLIGVFAVSFRDYRTDHFISAGVTCLLTGLLHGPRRTAELVVDTTWVCRQRCFRGMGRRHTCRPRRCGRPGTALLELPSCTCAGVAHCRRSFKRGSRWTGRMGIASDAKI